MEYVRLVCESCSVGVLARDSEIPDIAEDGDFLAWNCPGCGSLYLMLQRDRTDDEG